MVTGDENGELIGWNLRKGRIDKMFDATSHLSTISSISFNPYYIGSDEEEIDKSMIFGKREM